MLTNHNQLHDDPPVGEADSPGLRLELTIRAAAAKTRGMNMSRLAEESKVSRGTIYAWFTGEQTPQSWSLGRVAKTLDVPVRDLWDAWEGREAVPSTTAEAIDRLVERLDRNDETLTALLKKLDALANGAIVAGIARALNEAQSEPEDTPPARPRRRTPPPQA